MKHGSPIWNWIPLYSDEQQDLFQTRTFKCLFLQITVQIGGKLVRLREDSFSILIKQDAWEIIQYCGTRVRILSGSNCFFVVLLCHTAHYYRSKSHKILINNYADQTNKKFSLRMQEYNYICCESCWKSVYISRTKEKCYWRWCDNKTSTLHFDHTTSYQCCNREGAVTTVTTSAHNVMVQGRAPNENIV